MEEVYLLNQQAASESPSYYATIPAPVRYDKELKPMEKLLYGEISSLSNKWGFCIASNNYFAKLYGVDKATVSRWIGNLEHRGYVKREDIRNEKKQVVQRRVYMKDITVIARQRMLEEEAKKSLNPPIDEKVNTPLLMKKSIPPVDGKINTPIDEKVKDNIINNFNKELEEEDNNKAIPNASLGDSFGNIKSLYSDITGKKPTQYALNILKSAYASYGEELVLRALQESAEADKPLNYMKTTLADWNLKGIKTAAEADRYIEQFKKEKQEANKPKKQSKTKKPQQPKLLPPSDSKPIGYEGNWIEDLLNDKLNFDGVTVDNVTTADELIALDDVVEAETETEVLDPAANNENNKQAPLSPELKKHILAKNTTMSEEFLNALTVEKYEFFINNNLLKY